MIRRTALIGSLITMSMLVCPVASAERATGPVIVSEKTVADGPVAHPNAARTVVFRHTSHGVDGSAVEMSGSYLLPRTPPPPGGWPIAVFSHMTVGGADKCAPSSMVAGHPEIVRANSGDAIVARMLDAGFVVVRPDYEGIGTPGPHPYLMGASLARAVIDGALAVHAREASVGSDVVLVGHSEGAVASLFAAASDPAEWGPLRLRGVAAVTPPTEMRAVLELFSVVPVAAPGIGDVVGLAALLTVGASAVDPDFARIVAEGGLSPAATALLSEVESRCFGELSSPDSFGGLAPSELVGAHGRVALDMLADIADANDVRHLRIDPSIPIRIDAGWLDPVVPVPLASGLADTYRAAGNDVTFAVHAGGHTAVPTSPEAAAAISTWLIAAVSSSG
ncbi:Secretory lipase [Rhodococcus sp. AW25M09]|uniref:lipase family protein n=1 Tax=Rhodococcus sp. AW25M09 TaxID=1268303 RepID=UPI0002ACAFE5|nr:lipase family protein [Rhodococcus sp. AW25M09]CCQ17346.1 Secretory lipase [Rhodococcus sp. AW25M09]